jgi:hypothetical protein
VAALSPDGKILALGSDGGDVLLRDARSGEELGLLQAHPGGVYALAFSPDGKTLASSGGDATVLLWDLAMALRAQRPPAAQALDRELQGLWAGLADDDPAGAARAIWKMTETPQATVRFLKAQLRPIAPVDARQIARWVADLGSDRYRVRKEATDALEVTDQALAALHHALEGNPALETRRRLEQILERLEQSPPARHVRALRALEVLEHIGTPEAGEVLAALAQGAPAARLTQAAQQAHERLAGRVGR